MPSPFAGNDWNADALPDRNGAQDTITPSRTTEKDDEYLVVLTFENIGQSMQQVSDSSFASRMIAHIPGAELIEIAMTFHNKGQSSVFIPLDGHLNMTGNLDLGSNDINGVGDFTAAGDTTAGGQFLADDGTASLPGYAFTSEVDAGMFTPAAGILGLSNAGAEVARWDSSDGQVGFGTNSPTFGFDFAHADGGGVRMKRTTSGGSAIRIDSSGGKSYYQFARNGTVHATLGIDGANDLFELVDGSALGSNRCWLVDLSTKDMVIGDGDATPAAQCHIVQSSTTGAQPVLELDQDDVDVEFIEFDGAEAADALASISTNTTSGAVQKHIQITINGTKYWLAALADPS